MPASQSLHMVVGSPPLMNRRMTTRELFCARLEPACGGSSAAYGDTSQCANPTVGKPVDCYRRRRARLLLDLDPGVLDHPGPLCRVVAHDLLQCGWRAGVAAHAEAEQAVVE